MNDFSHVAHATIFAHFTGSVCHAHVHHLNSAFAFSGSTQLNEISHDSIVYPVWYTAHHVRSHPLRLYSIAYTIGVHFAQNSLSHLEFAGIVVIDSHVNSSLSYHPLNSYPFLVGFFNTIAHVFASYPAGLSLLFVHPLR